MINYELILLIAVLGVTYTYILTKPGQIFNGLYNKMDVWFKTDARAMKGKDKHWLFKVLIYCHLCFSGQFSAWLYLALNYKNYLISPLQTLLLHIFFVALTIFSAGVIKGIYTKYIEQS